MIQPMAVLMPDSMSRKAVPIHGVPRKLFEAQVSPSIAAEMIKYGWIYPIPGTTLYDSGDIAAAWARYLNGERPKLHPGGGIKRSILPPADAPARRGKSARG